MHKGYEEAIHRRGSSNGELVLKRVLKFPGNQNNTDHFRHIRMSQLESWLMPGVYKDMGGDGSTSIVGRKVKSMIISANNLTILVTFK